MRVFLTPMQKAAIQAGWRHLGITTEKDQVAFVQSVVGFRIPCVPDRLLPGEADKVIAEIHQREAML